MKLITIVVEQASAEGLSAALPRSGVSSVTISKVDRDATTPKHPGRQFRVELLVEEHAVDYVMAGLSFALSAGLIGECKGAWIAPGRLVGA